MKKIIRLTESDLARLVRRVINEEKYGSFGNMGRKDFKGDKYVTDKDRFSDDEEFDDFMFIDDYEDDDEDSLRIPDDMPSYKTKYRYRDEEDEITEKLHGRQHRLDKNKNGRLDKEDFKMLRKQQDDRN